MTVWWGTAWATEIALDPETVALGRRLPSGLVVLDVDPIRGFGIGEPPVGGVARGAWIGHRVDDAALARVARAIYR